MNARVQNTCWALVLLGVITLPAEASSQTREYRFGDGTGLCVHFNDPSGAEFAEQVLDAAVSAYQTLTQFEGFHTPGYSFASPDKNYAYDPDQIIDIYLGTSDEENAYEELGAKNKLFRDAPCFDTRKTGSARYEAFILLPSNYEAFIRNWEQMNPSPLGKRNINVDLRGTLIHEMTHVIVFYYNKNLDKAGEESAPSAHLDWYVEGLARYFETFAGARHDFYSQGFKQTLPDRIRFSRGGSNYFMRYPDQAFTGLRYENALFWRFMDVRFGMSAIESLSRRLRSSPGEFKEALEEVTGMDFKTLLERYATSVLLGDFELKEESGYLHPVASTKLLFDEGEFILLDGRGGRENLGRICRTDWIGSWEDEQASFGEASVAGDATEAADVSAWATDYVQLRLGPDSALPDIKLKNLGEGQPISVQLFVFTRGGSLLQAEPITVVRGATRSLDLPKRLALYSLDPSDLEKIVLALTNTDPQKTSPYEILA